MVNISDGALCPFQPRPYSGQLPGRDEFLSHPVYRAARSLASPGQAAAKPGQRHCAYKQPGIRTGRSGYQRRNAGRNRVVHYRRIHAELNRRNGQPLSLKTIPDLHCKLMLRVDRFHPAYRTGDRLQKRSHSGPCRLNMMRVCRIEFKQPSRWRY